MAFNPEVQKSTSTDTPAQHFPFMSKEISNLTPDRSKEFLFKGIGQALETGTNLADKIYDSVTLNATREKVDPEQKSYEDNLKNAYDEISGQPKTAGIMGEKPEDLPAQLKTLPQTLDKMEAARANGKFSESDHYQRLVDLTTQLRSRFPGKRELIDSEVSRITGVHPANQLVRSRLADINSFVDAAKESKNKVDSMALTAVKDGTLDYSMYAAWKSGDGKVTDKDILKQIGTEGKKKRIHEENMWGLEESKGNFEDQQRHAEQTAITNGYSKLDSALDALTISSGVSKIPIREYMEGLNTGKYVMPSGAQAEELATNLNIAKQRALQGIRKEWTQTLPGQSKPLAERLGGKMESYLKNISDEFDGWIGAVKSGKDLDVATLAQRQIKASQAEGASILENDPKFGKVVRLQKAIKDAMGPEAYAQFVVKNDEAWRLLTDPKQQKEIMNNFQDLVQQPKLLSSGQPSTLKEQVSTAKARGITGTQGAKFYDQMIDFVPSMLGKSIDNTTKENVVRGVFGVDNQGTVALFNRDTVNSKGMEVPGQHHVFDTLVSKQSIDHIWKLAKDTNKPELFHNTQMWAEHEFSTMLRDDLHDLGRYKEDFSGIEMGYDKDNHKFVAKPDQTTMQSYYGTAKVPPVLSQVLTRVNGSLDKINHIYEKSGESTDIYLYKLLTASGLDLDVADKMISAIQAAHQPKSNTENK